VGPHTPNGSQSNAEGPPARRLREGSPLLLITLPMAPPFLRRRRVNFCTLRPNRGVNAWSALVRCVRTARVSASLAHPTTISRDDGFENGDEYDR
jgi:hypothetical protein